MYPNYLMILILKYNLNLNRSIHQAIHTTVIPPPKDKPTPRK